MLIYKGHFLNTIFSRRACATAICACALALLGGFSGTSGLAFELRENTPEGISLPPAHLRALPLPTEEKPPAHPVSPLPLVESAPPRPQQPRVFRSAGDALNEGIRGLKSGKPSDAVAPLTYASDEGDVIAQWKLGRMYAEGEGVPRDDFKAYQLFSKIVENRADENTDNRIARIVANSFVALGMYHLTGIPNTHVKRNAARAAELFTYSATYFGDTEAQYRLGLLLIEGVAGAKGSIAVQKDSQQGVKWLKLAAERGHIPAQATLGKILYLGDGVPKQVALGLMWMRVAADRAFNPKDSWVRELYGNSEKSATEDEVRLSETYMRKYTRGQLTAYPAQ